VSYTSRDRRTADAVVARDEDLSPFRRPPGGWGPWHLDAAQRMLWTDAGGYCYEIDLDSCTSSAQVLDWICQITGKLWGGGSSAEHDAIVAGLVRALVDVLHPQANLCSYGRSRRLSRPQIRYLASRASEHLADAIDPEERSAPC
jgi:hypothetical protein